MRARRRFARGWTRKSPAGAGPSRDGEGRRSVLSGLARLLVAIGFPRIVELGRVINLRHVVGLAIFSRGPKSGEGVHELGRRRGQEPRPATGIAICRIVAAISDWRESAFG